MNDWMDMLEATLHTFREQKRYADRAITQVPDAELFKLPGDDANSIASIMKHVGGNLRSRWTDFLTTDGEKPDRDRDAEFEAGSDTIDAIRAAWEKGWQTLEASLAGLTPADLDRSVTIRGESLPVPVAVQRSLAHTAQHVGQIILLAKIHRGPDWQTLTMPKKKK
jgi:hypothetical protein